MTILGSDEVVQSYKVTPRGVGLGWEICFVCAEAPLGDGQGEGSCHENLAIFVQSREEGERVVALFTEEGCGARLDYREDEPQRVQVKIGACRAHQPNLRLLALQLEDKGLSAGLLRSCLPQARVERDRRK